MKFKSRLVDSCLFMQLKHLSSPELVTKMTTETFTDYCTESKESHTDNKSLENLLSRYSRSYSGQPQTQQLKLALFFQLKIYFQRKVSSRITTLPHHSPNKRPSKDIY